ncbi:MAG: lipid biosynthesis B12-binding/radical SAM protein [Candidatus Omnitrophica bacterium]|nr:lipid biosynthesis B12-binding/radical SAM protein [Candidatus Omnitrophota bacterium]
MKIVLISANTAQTPYPVYPLGMGIVAKALLDAGHQVVQFDFLHSGQSFEKLTQVLLSQMPDLVGISIRNIDNVNLASEQHYIGTVRQIVLAVRSSVKVPIVLGGAGFSIMPETILDAVGADYGIVGESESAVVDFVADIEGGKRPDRCIRAHNLVAPKNIGSAQYDSDIIKFYLKYGNMVGMQTKRGCIHKCVYCTYPLLEGRIFRPRPAVDVVDDIEVLIKDHHAGYIVFTDSIFNDDQGLFLNVLHEMKRRRLSVPWTGFIKPGNILEEHVLLMKETGLKAVEIGSDAASDIALKGIGKDFLFKDIISANDIFVRNGVATAHFFMFGGPGETKDSVMEGIENIIALPGTVSFMFMGIRILPETPLEKIALRDGVIEPGRDLLESVYYISPALDRQWLEKTMLEGFKDHRCCFFPADKFESSIKFLHQMGYSGSLWEMLSPNKMRRSQRSIHPMQKG